MTTGRKKREFVMLAHTYKDQDISDYVWSEKYDGIRCLWVPQMRGLIPAWSNDTIPSTGLFSRYGNVFRAPNWFLDLLPTDTLLDGELIAGTLQETMSIVRSHSGDWTPVMFHIFDTPAPQTFTTPGRVHNVHYSYTFQASDRFEISKPVMFTDVDLEGENYTTVRQQEIESVTEHLLEIKSKGGEGLILRKKDRLWSPQRLWTVLKVKKVEHGEGKVTAYVPAKEGKWFGMMGSLEINNKFYVSGFNEHERQNAERLFPLGKTIRYKYSGTTDTGIPREARFVR